MSAPQAPLDLSQRLTFIVQALRNSLASRAGRDRTLAPLVLVLWPYLHRLALRFEALLVRVREGGAAHGIRPFAAAPPAPHRPKPPRLKPCFPGSFAWLIRLVPDVAQFGGPLRYLLADPEFAALLAVAPQAGRILRPLCRMLAIDPGADLPAALFRPSAPPASPPQGLALPDPPAPCRPISNGPISNGPTSGGPTSGGSAPPGSSQEPPARHWPSPFRAALA